MAGNPNDKKSDNNERLREKKSSKERNVTAIEKSIDSVSPDLASTEDLQKLQASLDRHTKTRDLENEFSSKELSGVFNKISKWLDESEKERERVKGIIDKLEKEYKEEEKEYKKIYAQKKILVEKMLQAERKTKKTGNRGLYTGTGETESDIRNQLEIKTIENRIKSIVKNMQKIQDNRDRASARMSVFKEIKKIQGRVHGFVSRVAIKEVLQSREKAMQAKNEATKKTTTEKTPETQNKKDKQAIRNTNKQKIKAGKRLLQGKSEAKKSNQQKLKAEQAPTIKKEKKEDEYLKHIHDLAKKEELHGFKTHGSFKIEGTQDQSSRYLPKKKEKSNIFAIDLIDKEDIEKEESTEPILEHLIQNAIQNHTISEKTITGFKTKVVPMPISDLEKTTPLVPSPSPNQPQKKSPGKPPEEHGRE